MSIFESIKNAIFGHTAKAASPTPTPAPTPGPAGGSTSPPRPATATSTTAASGQTAGSSVVDVQANLDAMNARNAQKLNWRDSIVDLMKLVGLDSSLQHRKELAKELGYTGNTDDSASMNIWLHKQVMQQLAQHGGKVPDTLLR